MNVLVCTLQGRFGNQVMQYLFCRALAERFNLELRVDPWMGERVFRITHNRPDHRPVKRYNELELAAMAQAGALDTVNSIREPRDLEFRGYAQIHLCMIYTKRQAQSWLQLRPDVEEKCAAVRPDGDTIIGHRRVGDYVGYGGYPVVSALSYWRALKKFGLDESRFVLLSEESPTRHAGLHDDLSFMPDFYRMMKAPVLLRGNSSFSWLAGLLGDGLVLSPVVNDFGGGNCDADFVAGNHPKFTSHLDFVSDLYVAP